MFFLFCSENVKRRILSFDCVFLHSENFRMSLSFYKWNVVILKIRFYRVFYKLIRIKIVVDHENVNNNLLSKVQYVSFTFAVSIFILPSIIKVSTRLDKNFIVVGCCVAPLSRYFEFRIRRTESRLDSVFFRCLLRYP